MAEGPGKDRLILTDSIVSPDEAFEFFLDDLIEGWSGIIEIGVALKGPDNKGIRKKYGKNWVLANTDDEARALLQQVGHQLDRLQIGDTIAVLRQTNGNVYFFVNGNQYGNPTEHVPSDVYGMVILHSKGSSKSDLKEEHETNVSPAVAGVPFTLYEEDEGDDKHERKQSIGATSDSSPRPASVIPAPEPPGRGSRPSTARGLSTLTRQLSLPTHWTSDTRAVCNDNTALITLDETSEEYKKVKAGFRETVQREIKKIERIQNYEMFQRYMLSLIQLQKKLPADVEIERSLYHGTQKETINNIQSSGFNRGYAGKNAVKYGSGSYFAVSARYSAKNTYSKADADGLHYMFRCRVIVGRYCLGTQGMIEPALIPGKPGERYDSAVDNLSRPSMFITFKDDRAYPEYLITFS